MTDEEREDYGRLQARLRYSEISLEHIQSLLDVIENLQELAAEYRQTGKTQLFNDVMRDIYAYQIAVKEIKSLSRKVLDGVVVPSKTLDELSQKSIEIIAKAEVINPNPK